MNGDKLLQTSHSPEARGVDRTGNFLHFAPPVGVFSPESLKLFDEIRTARAEALTMGATERVGLYSGEITGLPDSADYEVRE